MENRLEGHCHCGGVKISIPGDTPGVVACHCEDCQRLHGNFFALLAADAGQVQWAGDLTPQWYDSSPRARRAHCPRCGSRLAKQASGSDRLLLSAGLFGPRLPRGIVRHLFVQSRPDWYAVDATSKD